MQETPRLGARPADWPELNAAVPFLLHVSFFVSFQFFGRGSLWRAIQESGTPVGERQGKKAMDVSDGVRVEGVTNVQTYFTIAAIRVPDFCSNAIAIQLRVGE
jgi:hypothetical protein